RSVLHVDADVGAARKRAAGAARRVCGGERLDAQVVPLARVRQPGQRAAERCAIEVVDARHGRPVIDLVLAPDATAEVDAPDPAVAALEPQRLEWNPHFSRPAVATTLRRDGPDRVPARIHFAPFVRD